MLSLHAQACVNSTSLCAGFRAQQAHAARAESPVDSFLSPAMCITAGVLALERAGLPGAEERHELQYIWQGGSSSIGLMFAVWQCASHHAYLR